MSKTSQAEEECSVSVGGDKDSGFVEERRVSLLANVMAVKKKFFTI